MDETFEMYVLQGEADLSEDKLTYRLGEWTRITAYDSAQIDTMYVLHYCEVCLVALKC